MSTALPMQAVLFPRSDADTLHAKEIARRILQAFPHALVDWDRGNQHVQTRLQELIALRTPEVILKSHRSFFGHVAYLSVSYPEWPNLSVSSYVHSNDAVFFDVSEPFNVELLKRAAVDLSAGLDFQFCLEAHRNSGFRTHTRAGKFTDPIRFLRDFMSPWQERPTSWALIDGALRPLRYSIPILTELNDWMTTAYDAILRWLSSCTYRADVDATLKRFASDDAFARAAVAELQALSPVRQSWAIDIAEVDHQNGILLDHGDWMTIIHLNDVPKGIVTAR